MHESFNQTENYEGNWTNLQQTRIRNNITAYKKLLQIYINDLPTEPNPESIVKVEPQKENLINIFKSFIGDNKEKLESLAESAEDRLNEIHSQTHYESSKDNNKHPSNLGVYISSEDKDVVFTDATPLNSESERIKAEPRHKDIINAHEKFHRFYSILPNKLKSVITAPFERMRSYPIKFQADEILARMAQLKNYFGFEGDETFTKEHLAYAKANYINDTNMDNNMKEFFEAIVDEDGFINIINTFPC